MYLLYRRRAANIYDSSGRRVATIVDRWMAAGRHTVTWLGQDDAGRVLASGHYFVRLGSGGEERRGKLTIIK